MSKGHITQGQEEPGTCTSWQETSIRLGNSLYQRGNQPFALVVILSVLPHNGDPTAKQFHFLRKTQDLVIKLGLELCYFLAV